LLSREFDTKEGHLMESCLVCGNVYDKAFHVILADRSTHVFDCFECAIHALAPPCAHCEVRIIGHGVDRGSVIFCSDHCARAASDAAVEDASIASFPASDPPAFSPSARAAVERPRPDRAQRLREGKVGWLLLWAMGIPVPLLLVFFALRGCT
jgi:hypothetical protein